MPTYKQQRGKEFFHPTTSSPKSHVFLYNMEHPYSKEGLNEEVFSDIHLSGYIFNSM
jgi:hypothetical protein